MKILALEFSSSRRSVAVAVDGKVRGDAGTRLGMATPALAMVEQALQQAGVGRGEIECVAVGLGPGSYNGIRSALALAQGFAMTGRVDALGVSSALALAHEAVRAGVIGAFCVAMDAQRGEFYAANFESGADGVVETIPLRIASGEEVRRWIANGQCVMGPDLGKVLPGATPLWPDAKTVAQLAAVAASPVAVELLKPIYLRTTAFVKVRAAN